MTIKGQKGWIKIGETLYPIDIDDLDVGVVHIADNVNVPPTVTVSIEPQELYRSIAQSTYVAPLDPGPPEMSDNDAFDLMDSIRKEMR